MTKTNESSSLPLFLVGSVAQYLPVEIFVQPLIDKLMPLLKQKHQYIFERLSSFEGKNILINPTDLPFKVKLYIDVENPKLTLIDKDLDFTPDATVKGSTSSLLALMQGEIDGDALFFSRELTIEGDTEIVVALRNAIDGEEIDLLEDILSILGPLKSPARFIVKKTTTFLSNLNDNASDSLLAPPQSECDKLTSEIEHLNNRVQMLEKKVRNIHKCISNEII